MSDLPFELLIDEMNRSDGSLLWIVDESLDGALLSRLSKREGLTAMTNRADAAELLRSVGLTALLNDFDFSELVPDSFDAIGYRVSKEKPVVHWVINQSRSLLKEGGRLLLAGHKGDGGKTYIEKAASYLGEKESLERGGKGSLLAVIVNQKLDSEALDDKDYSRLRLINPDEELSLFSKPGVFGWNKVDRGSAYLVEHLPEFFTGAKSGEVLLDLGCGYGYLTVMALQVFPDFDCIASDNNVAACRACECNLAERELDAEVKLENCAETVASSSVDWLLCNPPFHQGFGVEGELTDRFIRAASRVLKRGGKGLFVVNQFIPFEQKAEGHFSSVELLDRNRSFKLVAVCR